MQITKERVYKVKSSNRTFMELKSMMKRPRPTSKERSNRTFMELKLKEFGGVVVDKVLVLIVPLWN